MSAHETAEAILLVIKRIAKWLFFGALAIAAIVASLFGGRLLLDEYEARPQLVTSIGNVALGDRLADVLFREPDFVHTIDYEARTKKQSGASNSQPQALEFDLNSARPVEQGSGISVSQPRTFTWEEARGMPDANEDRAGTSTDPPRLFFIPLPEYALESGHLAAFLSSDGDDSNVSRLAYESKVSSRWIKISDAGQVVRIGYICKDSSQRREIGGVTCDGLGENILSRFEGGVKVQCIRDKSDANHIRYRVYDVARFGVRFHLVSNRVAAFEIMAPPILAAATGVKWAECV
jgi:hypothetical protein